MGGGEVIDRIVDARVHSTVASVADDFFSHRPLLQYVTLNPT